jgi:hypothetical protein
VLTTNTFRATVLAAIGEGRRSAEATFQTPQVDEDSMDRTLTRWFLAVVCSTIFSGCFPPYVAQHLRQIEPAKAVVGEAEASTVVFARPRSMLFLQPAMVLDGQENPLADLPSTSHFIARVASGPHVFAVCLQHCEFVEAELAPGKVYFIEVDPHMGGYHLRAIRKSSKDWAKSRDWISDTKQFVVDPAKPITPDKSKPEYKDYLRIYDEDRAAWKNQSADAQDLQRLRPEDGE